MIIGLAADVGQTAVSADSMKALQAMEPEFVLIAGDLSYAVCG
jgi:hypothetical protein